MTKDEFQKEVDDVITDCIRNDYSFGSYARKVTDAVWPLLEAAEKERDALRAEVIHIKEVEFPRKAQAVADGWRGKCERLEAKIAEMEKQEPYAFAVNFPETSRVELVRDLDEVYEDLIYEAHEVRKLYTLPGAKGE